MNIEVNCSDEELDDLFAFARHHSPACNTVCRPVPVVLEKVHEQSRRCAEDEGILPFVNEHIQLD